MKKPPRINPPPTDSLQGSMALRVKKPEKVNLFRLFFLIKFTFPLPIFSLQEAARRMKNAFAGCLAPRTPTAGKI
jgi:hypothetical protein